MDDLKVEVTSESVSNFKQTPVTKAVIKDILAAGMNASYCSKEKPWHFVVITDVDILSQLSHLNPYTAMGREALAAILVCGDLGVATPTCDWVMDCGAAVQSLLLAAQSVGLASPWTGIYPDELRMKVFRDLLHLPNYIYPHTFIPLGYPTDHVSLDLTVEEDRIHYNGWKK